jgi:hypothetical protein
MYDRNVLQVCFRDPRHGSGNAAKTPMHTRKQVMLDRQSGAVISEEDTYFSGATFVRGGADPGTDFEEMYITFTYTGAEAGTWQCTVNCGPDEGPHSLQEAEQILRKWGLTRS